RVSRVHAVDHASQVHVDDAIPGVERVVENLPAGPDAGVVEHVVETAMRGARLADERGHRGEVGDVDVRRRRVESASADLLDDQARGIVLDVGGYDMRAALGELLGE